LNSNSRYTVAIHMLTLLAHCGPDPVTSEFIAGSVNTNPVVIRRLLACLRAAQLVRSQGGPGGGWQLLKDPGRITLRDVLVAVDGASLFPLHTSAPNPRCPIGKCIQGVLAGPFRSALEAMEQDLERTTIAALVENVKTAAL
jgi:DNA-binding IscR family transcriptional regulator